MSAQLNLRAAAEVLRSRAGASRARNAASNAKKPLSVRNATKIYKGSSSSSVQRRITQLRDGDVARQPGRPRALTDEEDESLIAFVILTQKTGFPATRGEVEDAANSLRRKRDPKAADLSRMWYPRWRQDHPELEKATLMTIDSSRESWAVGGVDDVNLFFDRLEHAIRNFRIDSSTFWNTDEAGIRIGCLRNRIQCLIVRTAKRQRVQTVDPANRESCTLVGTGNAAGDTIPPWLIFKTFPTLDFSDVEADPNLRFARSDTAFNNSEIFLEWIRHFNSHSWSACTKAKQLGVTLEEWFGCNEHLRDPLHEHIQYEEPPTRRAEEDRIYRLLLLDGFTGHGSSELRLYGVKFDIIIVPLPAHSTHKLQPMDVGVFQPMKEAHQKKLRHAMRKGSISYSRLEFTKSFQDIFDTGFSRHNIMSGFEKSGMWPVDRKPILAFLEQKALQAQKSINPALPSLLPDEARFHRASVITKHISEKYHDVMSSPSRAGLRTVRKSTPRESVSPEEAWKASKTTRRLLPFRQHRRY
ncbi:hypothetical protein NW759_17768 [Fusarium solani]|uniref:HTH CENPB-type domain-containing protein n=1 Tax=Fusarium falciforme TaxID=195108 RepID=A0A9W8QSK0_9HYPO|nr:hypothetical protein NW755_14974 [Fusarium falciforme]KAJ4176721.1 hypothetical protein NW759_17768 [Fusarium solani]